MHSWGFGFYCRQIPLHAVCARQEQVKRFLLSPKAPERVCRSQNAHWCRGGLQCIPVFVQKVFEESQRQSAADDIGKRCGPDHAVYRKQTAKQKHHRDIQQALAKNGKQKRPHSAACCLKERNTGISAGRKRRANAQNTQKIRSILQGGRSMPDENPDQLRAEQQTDAHARRCDPNGKKGGERNGTAHAFPDRKSVV